MRTPGRLSLWGAALWLAAAALPATAAEVEGLRVWSGPKSTRVVLDLSGPADHRLLTLDSPARIVVDLAATSLGRPIALPEPKGYVADVRTGKRPDGALRVVLDLSKRAEPKTFFLPPNDKYGHRLVVDLLPADAGGVVRRAARPVASERGRDLVVVVDAGHGGEDPGAIGPSGVREKDVVLAIAERLAARLEREPGIRPIMTRTRDHYVSHSERIRTAREAEAELFVSIHADAYENALAKGATVYTLSTRRATDEVTRRVVERENAADLIGGVVSIADKDDVLARILLDLSQNYAMSASVVAGQRVIDELRRVTRMRKAKPQQGSFIVLTSPDVPSLLIETAYITNPSEEEALASPLHQRRIAGALHAGIVEYFRTHAPSDTYFANHLPDRPAAPREHVISRGETLSEIAERYRVSVRALKSSNSLSGDRIRIGQVLTIPPG